MFVALPDMGEFLCGHLQRIITGNLTAWSCCIILMGEHQPSLEGPLDEVQWIGGYIFSTNGDVHLVECRLSPG